MNQDALLGAAIIVSALGCIYFIAVRPVRRLTAARSLNDVDALLDSGNFGGRALIAMWAFLLVREQCGGPPAPRAFFAIWTELTSLSRRFTPGWGPSGVFLRTTYAALAIAALSAAIVVNDTTLRLVLATVGTGLLITACVFISLGRGRAGRVAALVYRAMGSEPLMRRQLLQEAARLDLRLPDPGGRPV